MLAQGFEPCEFFARCAPRSAARETQERRSDRVAREPFVLSGTGGGKGYGRHMIDNASKPKLTHIDQEGHVRMVDVGHKPVTDREAVARGAVRMSSEALALIRTGRIAKGDPLQAARIAGIMAAKRTADLIPLCHPLPLSQVEVSLNTRDSRCGASIGQ